MVDSKEKLRIDKYLWAIRIFKTRSQAADACERGKVKLQGNSIKPSKAVNMGEEYEIKTEARKWVIKVTGLLQNRMPYSEAVKYYLDITPAIDLQKPDAQNASYFTGKRLSKTGKPSKKQRRDFTDYLGE